MSPYRTAAEPTPPREPAGQCPRCGEDIWDLAKWKADGKTHADCAGSHSARLGRAVDATLKALDERDERIRELEAERDALRLHLTGFKPGVRKDMCLMCLVCHSTGDDNCPLFAR